MVLNCTLTKYPDLLHRHSQATKHASAKHGGAISSQADWSNTHAVELYLHNTSSPNAEDNDVYEARNVAKVPLYSGLVAEMAARLRAGWRKAH